MNYQELRQKIDNKIDLHDVISLGRYYKKKSDNPNYTDFYYNYHNIEDLQNNFIQYLKQILKDKSLYNDIYNYLNFKYKVLKDKGRNRNHNEQYTFICISEIISVIRHFKIGSIDQNLKPITNI